MNEILANQIALTLLIFLIAAVVTAFIIGFFIWLGEHEERKFQRLRRQVLENSVRYERNRRTRK